MFLGGIARSVAARPDRLALTDGSVTLTWSQLAVQVEAVAAQLRSSATAGVRVGVTGENAAHTLITHLAGLLSGVGTVAVHRQATVADLEHELREADCNAVVAGPSTIAAVIEIGSRMPLLASVIHSAPTPPGCISWDRWCQEAPATPADDLATRVARPLLVYTSGTTGRARATPVRWAPPAVMGSAQAYAHHLASRSGFPDGPHLVVGPLQHNGPLTSVRHLIAGQPVVVMPRFDAQEVLRLIEAHRITSTVMVPTHFTRLLALAPDIRTRRDISSLRTVAHTGSACPPDVKRAMIDWFGPVLVESYGGSELGTVARITSTEWLDHPGSVGKAVPPLTISAYHQDGTPLPVGRVGLLGVELTDGRHVEFVGDAQKSREAYLRSGVATLGDIGYVDHDGFVYITDRQADMVISGGVNLYPAESERVLRQHDSVDDVAVIGIPDADMGEALHALIVSADADLDLAELDRFCGHELARFKCPRSYERVGELIRNEMGKVDKRAIRQSYWQNAITCEKVEEGS